jgi:hypothetical protein|eukprot:COSAG01_NODE_10327_length_2192_cov_5.359771_4_plen_155_part_00
MRISLLLTSRGLCQQVASSLQRLAEQVDEVLGTPMRAFYDDQIKPLRGTKTAYDRSRHRQQSALKASLGLKRTADAAVLRQADAEVRAKDGELERYRFELHSVRHGSGRKGYDRSQLLRPWRCAVAFSADVPMGRAWKSLACAGWGWSAAPASF